MRIKVRWYLKLQGITVGEKASEHGKIRSTHYSYWNREEELDYQPMFGYEKPILDEFIHTATVTRIIMNNHGGQLLHVYLEGKCTYPDPGLMDGAGWKSTKPWD